MTEAPRRWTRLTTECLQNLQPHADLAVAIRGFEPLDYEGGLAARNWLDRCLSERAVGLETQLAWGPDPRLILGVYVIRPAAFYISREDRRLLGLLRRVRKDFQTGALLELIARDHRTPPGFGGELILHALGNTLEKEAVALVVEANEEVAEKVWSRHRFVRFTDPRPRGPGMTTLLHPVREPEDG